MSKYANILWDFKYEAAQVFSANRDFELNENKKVTNTSQYSKYFYGTEKIKSLQMYNEDARLIKSNQEIQLIKDAIRTSADALKKTI